MKLLGYYFFHLLYAHYKHQDEAIGVNLNAFHIIWVQMDLHCYLVCCQSLVVSLQQTYETG